MRKKMNRIKIELNLNRYSQEEMDQLYYDQVITKNEYAKELEKRGHMDLTIQVLANSIDRQRSLTLKFEEQDEICILIDATNYWNTVDITTKSGKTRRNLLC
jgi:hypothetical protein